MSHHARIYTDTLGRIFELTKREAFVYLYLLACRNEKTGKCNPSRTAIAAALDVGFNVVWEGLAGLKSKGWIAEDPDGGFLMIPTAEIRAEKVPESGSKQVPESGSKKRSTGSGKRNVPENGTFRKTEVKVPENGSKGSGIRKLHIRNLSEQRIEQRKEQLKPLSGETPHEKKPVEKVFEYWQKKCGHPAAKLSPKRSKLITARLKEFPIADLFAAVDGCAASGWHNGENPGGKVWDDIGINICRDIEHVEMFRDLAKTRPRPVNRPPDIAKAKNADRPCATCGQIRFISDPDGVDEALPCPACSGESYNFVMRQRRATIAA